MLPVKVYITLDMEHLKLMLESETLGVKNYVDCEFEHGRLTPTTNVTANKKYFGIPFELEISAPFYKYKKEGN
jgi:hypothetical protein